MKWITAIIILLFLGNTSFALNKYVDSTGGNDANSGNSPAAAYKSISKVNSIYSSLTAGDSILFKRGEFWHDRLTITKNGMHIGAYGSGNKPRITGLVDVTGWTNTGGNIWQSAAISGSNTYMSMVTINDVAIAMGRWPNTGSANGGYATYNTLSSATAITSVTAMPFDFTGMTLCMRKIADILAREPVTSVSGTTINHTDLTGGGYRGYNGYGYFIENSLSTLDAQNEWYFNTSTRRLHMYSTGSPAGVRISTIDTLIYVAAFDNTTFDDIALEGGNVVGIQIGGPTVGNSTGITVNRCDFVNMGRDGIFATNDNNLVVDSCYFNHMMNNAISLGNQGGRSVNVTATNNIIKNVGIPGMGFLDYANGFKAMYEGITNASSAVGGETGMTVKFNSIDTVGHVGIRFYQNNTFVDSNYVNYHNFITDDAGAINTFDNFTGLIETNRTIIGNICTNGIGAGLGAGGQPNVNGIYVDDKADGVIIRRNFVGTVSPSTYNGSCYYIHNGTNLDILLNTAYDGGYSQLTLAHDDHAIGLPLRNINVQNNLFFSKLNTSYWNVTRTRRNDADSIFNPINNNRYWRPSFITGATFQVVRNYQIAGQTVSNYTLPTWKTTFSGALNGPYDAASTEGGSNPAATDFVYNFTNHDSTLNFSGLSYLVPQYNSPYEQVYNNSMNLAPYTGYIRVANGTVAPVNKFPVADAGANIEITLPVNSTNIIGTGSDSDGVVVSYAWSQILGPSTATLSPTFSTSTGTTTASNLVEGSYFFQLQVTDNNGATGTNSVRVTVWPAVPNTPPTANAGADKTITLPTTTTSVTGTGTNGSGASRTYLWSQVSGPATANIVTPTAATTTINNLTVDGTYTIKFRVENNLGDTAVDYMQIFVNPAPIIPPTADAGPDKAIQLPTTSTSATATATLGSGSLVSYTWSFVSGPATATFGSANSLTTTINNLTVQGNYTVKFTVLNSQGNSASDNIDIVVSPAVPPVNQPPVSVPGTNQEITLPTNSVNVNGSGSSDPDGTITGYIWTIIGPGSPTNSTPTSVSTTFGNLSQGVYLGRLRVIDNSGDTSSATMTITVNPAPNNLPTAAAGIDQTLTLPVDNTTLNGSGSSDPDGAISAYQWRQLSGPATATLATPNSVSTTLDDLIAGDYIFQLWVQGNAGASDTAVDAMKVTVLPAIVLDHPLANAGTDQTITLPVNSVTLSGSGTDSDGTIVSHVWTLFSGPAGSIISFPNSYSTLVSNLQEGTYLFQLEVTDNDGLMGTDLVEVIVHPPLILQRVLIRGYKFR